MTPFYIILAIDRCCSIQGKKGMLCNAGQKDQCQAYSACLEDINGSK